MTRPEHTDERQSSSPWYIVLEDWHPFPHLGLDGIPWPLDGAHDATSRVEASSTSLPFELGECTFDVCYDLGAASAYFDAAEARRVPVYLIEVGTLESPMIAADGFDLGRPDGGFSIIGQEICKTEEGHRRFGHLLDEHGLFPSEDKLREYLAGRERRVITEGLEHLDESMPVKIRVLDLRGPTCARPSRTDCETRRQGEPDRGEQPKSTRGA